ncbi:MAG: DUF512 domain-containing protein [Candidatus Marinimicrobia bacterium]|nr:DUF512 domain-containing protein [Candidatus Neomarinimicrobiota bacterium]MBT3634932.1 DUF512 domain-containing protein [Candidatus Neomarinimicrobiota bacterium]MBT3683782.1 DUF512 domain-containing protein [Candidatus Neomarinimicrobiota bacterium]MBT3760566.1 DUF512 domain-containing protein [Candidatus Neomarinimicrobiota bacterium]MBT3896695.1 DUF512 domain-containing protein [Candidatus Neomarinimicrobiota bacterium]
MKILSVQEDTLGHDLGLKPGDSLLKINGKKVADTIDYQFRITEENVLLVFEIDGKFASFDIEKDYDTDLGVEFEEFKIRSCANDCVFCFVDQNPKDMRQTLYFRDGDFRLSYLHGHYITLTNMGQKDLNRIVEQRLSPLYISVHATDPDLRKELFLYKKDDFLLEKLSFLIDNDIELHTQIVLMPDKNDGDQLIRTLTDIYQYFPKLQSCSIVPVGLTDHRDGLMKLSTVSPDYAKQFLQGFPQLRKQFNGVDHPFLFLSDEWYILADHPFPPLYEYDDVDVVENGVGQVAAFLDKFENEKALISQYNNVNRNFSIATGTLIHGLFEKEVGGYLNNLTGINVSVYPVKNDFLGHSVTVSGLLTGRDIVDQLKDKNLGEALWISHRILDDDGTKTLDDMTLEEMSASLGVPVNISNDSILEIFKRNIHG